MIFLGLKVCVSSRTFKSRWTPVFGRKFSKLWEFDCSHLEFSSIFSSILLQHYIPCCTQFRETFEPQWRLKRDINMVFLQHFVYGKPYPKTDWKLWKASRKGAFSSEMSRISAIILFRIVQWLSYSRLIVNFFTLFCAFSSSGVVLKRTDEKTLVIGNGGKGSAKKVFTFSEKILNFREVWIAVSNWTICLSFSFTSLATSTILINKRRSRTAIFSVKWV